MSDQRVPITTPCLAPRLTGAPAGPNANHLWRNGKVCLLCYKTLSEVSKPRYATSYLNRGVRG